jgi:hypothetical protein
MDEDVRLMTTIKIIIIIGITLGNYACSSYKFYNETICSLDKQVIIRELKKQRAIIKETDIFLFLRDTLQYKQNCSVFYFSILKWENVKNQKNIVTVTVLRTTTNIYVNTYYIKGKLRRGFNEQIVKDYVDLAIQSFREENIKILDEQTLSEIESSFRFGVNVIYPFIQYK